MREILFRGKITQDKWSYGFYENVKLEEATIHYVGRKIVIPETVGQFTGLTDKNGKKIFEGDIVKTKEFGKDSGNGVNFNNFDVFEVIYSSASFKLNNSCRLFNVVKGQKFEVIGNIHDNPELLKEQQNER